MEYYEHLKWIGENEKNKHAFLTAYQFLKEVGEEPTVVYEHKREASVSLIWYSEQTDKDYPEISKFMLEVTFWENKKITVFFYPHPNSFQNTGLRVVNFSGALSLFKEIMEEWTQRGVTIEKPD